MGQREFGVLCKEGCDARRQIGAILEVAEQGVVIGPCGLPRRGGNTKIVYVSKHWPLLRAASTQPIVSRQGTCAGQKNLAQAPPQNWREYCIVALVWNDFHESRYHVHRGFAGARRKVPRAFFDYTEA